MSRRPIADYALLSDCHSAALVSRDGSVDWLCVPRFDSPSVFGRILDDQAGHWSITPSGTYEVSRRYLDDALAIETTFRTEHGVAVLLDVMAVGRNEQGHELGAESPHALLRRLSVTQGSMQFDFEFVPRMEYGLVSPYMQDVDGGILARGGATVLLLSTSMELRHGEHGAATRFALVEGQQVGFSLQARASWEAVPRPWDQETIEGALRDTIDAWRSWSEMHTSYEGPWRELVRHSGRVLWALTYYPTGAMIAAPTTSLPETVGGTRNWDYRYSWIRDASLTLGALWVAACPDEAARYFEFLTSVGVTEARGHSMQIMYGVGGEHDLHERELPHLAGWRSSRPVRVGNAAWEQDQLDVYGALLDAAHQFRDYLQDIDQPTKAFLVKAADAAAERWEEPDHGIWEIRAERRHYLHSKLMCWVALDRAIQLAELIEAGDRVEEWQRVRDEIRAAILDRGWSEPARAFTQAFGSDALDASALMLAISGFLPASDPRMGATIEAISERLTDQRGLVYRYIADDGLDGGEGTFLLCTFWLAQALAEGGELGRARIVFERAIRFANDVGLLAEEVEPSTGELIGNFPQAFSHIGLINAAWAIASAEEIGDSAGDRSQSQPLGAASSTLNRFRPE